MIPSSLSLVLGKLAKTNNKIDSPSLETIEYLYSIELICRNFLSPIEMLVSYPVTKINYCETLVGMTNETFFASCNLIIIKMHQVCIAHLKTSKDILRLFF